jgi:hypothetical protein
MKPILGILATFLVPATAWAQAQAQPNASGGSAGLTALVIGAVLFIVIVAGVKLFDLKRKRESEAVQLQAQISDALLRDQAMFGLPITPTAHIPFWTGTPATVELAGQVPSPELRESATRIARDEATRMRPDAHIEDRLAVVPTMARAA